MLQRTNYATYPSTPFAAWATKPNTLTFGAEQIKDFKSHDNITSSITAKRGIGIVMWYIT